jgi:hypothetical protein
MPNRGNQRTMPANRRRMAEALARVLMNGRTEEAARGAPLNDAVLAQAFPPLPQMRGMPAPVLPQAQMLSPEIPAENAAPRFEPPPVNPQAPSITGELPPAATRRTLELSADDIKNLKKVLMTEAVSGLPPEVYRQQAAGIVDTILNRRMHGKWGDSIASVVNAPYQFSDINGPVSWRSKRKSVEEIGDDVLNRGAGRVASQFVDEYLAARAAGLQSAIGGHLNYANPYYSDASNLAWIRKLDGPRLGQGRAVHWHGTAQGLNPVDPNYVIRVAGQQQFPSPFGANIPFNAANPPQFGPVPQQQQPPLVPDNAPAPQQRGGIHPAILEAMLRQNMQQPAGIDPEVWKHMSEEERAAWQTN